MIYELCEGVTLEDVDGSTVLIDEQGNAAILNDMATDILPRLLSPIDHVELYKIISDEYGVSLNTSCSDIDDFISEMIDKGLLQQCAI